MKRKYREFDDFFKESMKNPKIKAEYDRLQPEYEVIHALIRARIEKDLTQAKLAKKMGTKQSVISRLERGNANPSLAFLQKLAKALDSHLEIKFVS